MSAARLIRDIEECGGFLWLVGEDIKVCGASKVPRELIDRLRESKPAAVKFLKACDLSANPGVHLNRKPVNPEDGYPTEEEAQDWAKYDRLVIATMARIGANQDG